MTCFASAGTKRETGEAAAAGNTGGRKPAAAVTVNAAMAACFLRVLFEGVYRPDPLDR